MRAQLSRDADSLVAQASAPHAKRAVAGLCEVDRHPFLIAALGDPDLRVRRVASWLVDAVYPTALAEMGDAQRDLHFQNLAELGRSGVRSRLFHTFCRTADSSVSPENLDQLAVIPIPSVAGAFAELWCRRIRLLLDQNRPPTKTALSLLAQVARARPLVAWELAEALLVSADAELRGVGLAALPGFCLGTETRPLVQTRVRLLTLEEFFPLAEELAKRSPSETATLAEAYGLDRLRADARWRRLVGRLALDEGPSTHWLTQEISATAEADYGWLGAVPCKVLLQCRPALLNVVESWRQHRRNAGSLLQRTSEVLLATCSRTPAERFVWEILGEAEKYCAVHAANTHRPELTGRLAILRDLLVVSGIVHLIPGSMANAWVAAMDYAQIDAARRLEPHAVCPVVAVALALRTFTDDPDDAHLAAHRSLCRTLPRVGLPLAYSQSLNPDRSNRDLGLDVLFQSGFLEEAEGLRAVLSDACLRLHRQIDPEPTLEFWIPADGPLDASPEVAHVEPGEVAVLESNGRDGATALFATSEADQVAACRSMRPKNPLLAVVLAARVYSEPTRIVHSDGGIAFTHGPPHLHSPAAESLLLEWAPEVKSWLDLQATGRLCFESVSDPGIPPMIEGLLRDHPGLRQVCESLPV